MRLRYRLITYSLFTLSILACVFIVYGNLGDVQIDNNKDDCFECELINPLGLQEEPELFMQYDEYLDFIGLEDKKIGIVCRYQLRLISDKLIPLNSLNSANTIEDKLALFDSDGTGLSESCGNQIIVNSDVNVGGFK